MWKADIHNSRIKHKDGIPWHKCQKLKWWQRPFHRHSAQTKVRLGNVDLFRCRCGRVKFSDYGTWVKA